MFVSRSRRYKALPLVIGLLILLYYYYCYYYYYHQEPGYQKVRKSSPIARDTITSLDNRTFIISPYYDPRGGRSVRVLAIIHESLQEFYCRFHCSLNHNVSVRATIDLHDDRFGFHYGAADLLCTEPSECDYTYMTFHFSNSPSTSENLMFKVKNRPPQPVSSSFTVCISTFHGKFNNVLQMIQSIEMYKILGASRVTIYNTSCSQDVDKVLRHYIDEGTVEVVPWPIDQHLETSKKWRYSEGLAAKISYYGQTAALNDCLYRNMYKSKFVLLNDIDEIILPLKHWDWSSLMEDLQKKHPDTNVFCIEDHVFPTSVNSSGFDLWSHVPGVNILHHSAREPINWNTYNARKLIVNPRGVFQTSIHVALKHKGLSKNIPQDMAITFHCTHQRRDDITTKDLIPDDILWRYNTSLVPNVDKVIQRLFPQQL